MTLCTENKDCKHYKQCKNLIPSVLLFTEIEKCKYYEKVIDNENN